jgi:hypothetical protein
VKPLRRWLKSCPFYLIFFAPEVLEIRRYYAWFLKGQLQCRLASPIPLAVAFALEAYHAGCKSWESEQYDGMRRDAEAKKASRDPG